MPTYFVFRPEMEITAEVNAPDKRHARTAYLDYLARNGMIGWSDRGTVRKTVKAVKAEPGEFEATVILDYGISEPAEEKYLGFPEEPPEAALAMEEEGEEEEYPGYYEEEGVDEEDWKEEEEELPIRSPIMELSRRVGGL